MRTEWMHANVYQPIDDVHQHFRIKIANYYYYSSGSSDEIGVHG